MSAVLVARRGGPAEGVAHESMTGGGDEAAAPTPARLTLYDPRFTARDSRSTSPHRAGEARGYSVWLSGALPSPGVPR